MFYKNRNLSTFNEVCNAIENAYKKDNLDKKLLKEALNKLRYLYYKEKDINAKTRI